MNASEANALGQRIAGLLQDGQVVEAHSLLSPVLGERTPFRYLDRIGAAAGAAPLPTTHRFLDTIAAESAEGGWVIIGAVLGRQLQRDWIGAFARCRSMAVAADVWYGADILGERLPGGFWRSLLDFLSGFYVLDAILTANWAALWDVIKHLILPSVALGSIPMAIIARMTRSSLLDVLGEDYVRTARAKGLRERSVLFAHSLKNALLPIITVVGLQLGFLLGGAILTETIFSWPGLGRLVVNRILARDYPAEQGSVIDIALTFVVINLFVDVIYAFVDPRIRYE